MAYLHHLPAEKDPSLMSVTIHSHPFLSFASKITNAKQPGLTLLNLVDVLYKRRSRKGKQVSAACSPCVPYRTPREKSPGESAAAAATTRTRSSFTGVSQCVENSGEPWRHFEIAVPCQLYPASRSALTGVSHCEALGNRLHVKL